MFKELNPILHSQLRLAVMSLLVKYSEMEFTEIKKQTEATAGNLSIQLKKLQNAGYIEIEKSFKNNYPNTKISITEKGLAAFDEYVKALKDYFK
jgi:DNA-binding MarR family transcriptional regulator